MTLPSGGSRFSLDSLEVPSPVEPVWEAGWPQTVAEFQSLVETLQHRLVRFAHRRLGSLQDAEDVVQEVLLKSFTAREKLKNTLRVMPYLYRMTANACIDLQRKRKSGGEVSLEGITPFSVLEGEADMTVSDAEKELERIEALLSGLPPRQAEVIRLRVLDELSFAQIAEILGCRLPTVKSRFRYGLEKLRARLLRKNGEGR